MGKHAPITDHHVAIRNLYAAFVDPKNPIRKIPQGGRFLSDAQEDELLNKPSFELSITDLKPYLWIAAYDAGLAEDFLYFLPRTLELLLTSREAILLPEFAQVPAKIGDSGRVGLSQEQSAALDGFFRSAVTFCCRPEHEYRLDDWVCAAAVARCEMQPIFTDIERYPFALSQFRENLCIESVSVDHVGLGWETAHAKWKELVEWLRSDRVGSIVRQYEERGDL